MIEKVQQKTFEFITDLFSEYGIPMEFKYDPNLDVLNEFRRSIRLRVENKSAYEELLKDYAPENEKYVTNLGIFSRSPIRKNSMIGNNMDLEVFCRKYHEETNHMIELRSAFFGEVRFNIKMLFDSHDISDMIELIYLDKLANKQKSFKLDYNLGEDVEPIEDVGYSITFSELENVSTVNSSNLRQLDFSVELSGLFFLPFIRSGGLLDRIVVELHVMSGLQKIDPQTATDETLVDKKEFIMVRD